MATFKSYRELICWQLAAQIRREMIEVTERPTVRQNLKFCDQVGDSTRSAPANISEGFKRSNPMFIKYLDVALGSLQETENHVDEALERKYVTPDEHAHFRLLAKRAIRAAEELRSYLRRCSPLPHPTRARQRTNLPKPEPTRRHQTEPAGTRTNPTQPDETCPNPNQPDET